MIISTKKGTPKEELEKIVAKFEQQGLDVTLITGKDYNVFGLVGDTLSLIHIWFIRKVITLPTHCMAMLGRPTT